MDWQGRAAALRVRRCEIGKKHTKLLTGRGTPHASSSCNNCKDTPQGGRVVNRTGIAGRVGSGRAIAGRTGTGIVDGQMARCGSQGLGLQQKWEPRATPQGLGLQEKWKPRGPTTTMQPCSPPLQTQRSMSLVWAQPTPRWPILRMNHSQAPHPCHCNAFRNPRSAASK